MQTGQQQAVETHWHFLCLGGLPNTDWAAAAGIVHDEQNYLVTGADLRRYGLSSKTWPLEREPYYLETSTPACLQRVMFATGLSNAALQPSARVQWSLTSI
jgi:thioredoxin reductase (NADPH)